MKQSIITIIIILVTWASLFVTVLDQSARTHQLLRNDKTLLSQETDIINGQTITIKVLSGKIDDLQSHVDCLFNLATQPNHSSAYIANAHTCAISSSAPASSNTSGGAKAPLSSVSHPQSAPKASQKQGPQSQLPNPGLVKQFFNFLGL